MSNLFNLLNLDRIKLLQSDLNERLLKKLNKSIVFADNQFIEWFNLTTGLDYLIKNAGVFNIKEFSSFEVFYNLNGGEYLKAVFFISQPIKGIILEILKDILTSSRFQFITIITNLNPLCYEESFDYFDELKDKCLMWMSNANYTCDIFYEKFPFIFLPQNISNEENCTLLFLNPLSSWSLNSDSDSLYQLVNLDLYQRLVKQEMNELHTLAAGSGSSKEHFQNYYQNFSQKELEELRALSFSLNEMLEHLDAKDDCFTLGILSAIVSNELNLSQTVSKRRKNAANKVTLLLIDRNLDLSASSLFQDETTFDKINNLLPNLTNTSNDVLIDLKNFIFENNFKSCLPGNYFHFSSDACKSLIEQFLISKPKECLLDIYRKLCEVYPLNDKKTFRINSDSLKNQIRNGLKVNKKAFFENIDLIQIISAYCQISDPQCTKQAEFDKLITQEKLMTQSILDKDGPSILSRIYALFSEKFDRNEKSNINFSLSDLIIVLIYVYSLIGEECFYGIEEENRIKKLLINELESESFQNDFRFRTDRDFFDKIKKQQSYSQFIDKFFQNLKYLKSFRKNLKQYNKLVNTDEEKNQYSYKPLIKQVCENLIRTNPVTNNTEQLLDIEYRTSNTGEGLGLNLFKSFKIGFMNTSNKIHPLNNDLIIIYFIGGITSYEFKTVKQLFKEAELRKNILIGSSHFYNQAKLMKYLFN